MNEWIEINLPWQCNEWPTTTLPDLQDKWKHSAEMNRYEEEADAADLFTKYHELKSEYIDNNNLDNVDADVIYNLYPELEPVKRYRELNEKYSEWYAQQPEVIECEAKRAAEIDAIKQKSFCGRKLNKPGTLIEVDDSGKIKTLLIGDINVLGGVCDDCHEFDDYTKAIIKRYKVLDISGE